MAEQYTVNEPDSPMRAAAVKKALERIKKLAMIPEASLRPPVAGGNYVVLVQWGAVSGVKATFPAVDEIHAKAIVEAINKPLTDRERAGA